jgi:hypothetical protein
MNKRMFELLAEARDITVEQCMKAPHGSAILTPAQLEAYTKLIVQDCVDIVDTAEPYKASDLIKKHFGVKQ